MDIKPNARLFGAYTLIERRGSGGFGEVWRAQAPGGFEVALKFVQLDFDSFQQGSPEFRSLDVIRNIRHIHLLTPSKAFRHEDYLILEMELAEDSLFDRLRLAQKQGQSGIPLPDLLRWMRQAAEGIDFLNGPNHTISGRGGVRIQHRDIKPQNILVMQGGVKIADFSLARLLEGKTSSQTGSMTVSYAAPEFFNRTVSEHSDQYSLAVTYVHLRTGRLPYTGSEAQIMAGHLMGNPDLGSIPQLEQKVLHRSLAKAPQSRFGSCREFVEALSEAVRSSSHATTDVYSRTNPVAAPTAPGAAQPRPVYGPVSPNPPAQSPANGARAWNPSPPPPMPTPARPNYAPNPAPPAPPRHAANFGPSASPPSNPVSYRPPQPVPNMFPASTSATTHTPAPPTRGLKPTPQNPLSLELDDDGSASGNHEMGLDSTFFRRSASSSKTGSPTPTSPGTKPNSTKSLFRPLLAIGLLAAIAIATLSGAMWARWGKQTLPQFADAREEGDYWRDHYDFYKAADAYTKAIETNPTADAYAARALMYLRLGKDRMALKDSDEALKRDDKCVLGYAVRGCARPFGQRGAATADLQRSLQLDPNSIPAHVLQGLMSSAYGEFDSAHQWLAKASEKAPNDPWPLANDAIVYTNEGQYDQAIERLSKAIRIDGSYHLAFSRRADAHRLKGNWDAAFRDYDEAIRVCGDSFHPRADRAFARRLRKDYEGALSDYAEAIRLAPNHAPLYASRGDLHWERMQYAEASEDYERAANLNPGHRPYRLSLSVLQTLLAKDQIRQGQNDKAEVTLELAELAIRGVARELPMAQAYVSRVCDVLIQRGEFYESTGKLDRAASFYRQGMALGSDIAANRLITILERQPRLAQFPDELDLARRRAPQIGWLSFNIKSSVRGLARKEPRMFLIAKLNDVYSSAGDDPLADEWRRLLEDEEALAPEDSKQAMRKTWTLARQGGFSFAKVIQDALNSSPTSRQEMQSDPVPPPSAEPPAGPSNQDESPIIREKDGNDAPP